MVKFSYIVIIWVIESRKMRLAVHVARIGDMNCSHGILAGRPKGKLPA